MYTTRPIRESFVETLTANQTPGNLGAINERTFSHSHWSESSRDIQKMSLAVERAVGSADTAQTLCSLINVQTFLYKFYVYKFTTNGNTNILYCYFSFNC